MSAQSDRVALFERAFRVYYAPLCDFVARYTGSNDIAQDVVSAVFTRLWAMDSTGDVERLTTPYLYRAARNGAAELRRRRAHEIGENEHDAQSFETRPSAAPASTSTSSDAGVHEQELATAVRIAIDALPERARLAFILRRQRGMTTAETASAMGISTHAVEMHLWRALRLLRQRLAPHLLPVAMVVVGLHRVA